MRGRDCEERIERPGEERRGNGRERECGEQRIERAGEERREDKRGGERREVAKVRAGVEAVIPSSPPPRDFTDYHLSTTGTF